MRNTVRFGLGLVAASAIALPAMARADRAQVPQEVSQFTSYVEQMQAMPARADHRSYVQALQRLAAAFEAIEAPEGVDLDARAERIRGHAEQLQALPRQSREHANVVRSALGEAFDGLTELQRECEDPSAIDDALQSTRAAIARIDPRTPLTKAQNQVQRAFSGVSTTLSDVASGRGDCLREGVAWREVEREPREGFEAREREPFEAREREPVAGVTGQVSPDYLQQQLDRCQERLEQRTQALLERERELSEQRMSMLERQRELAEERQPVRGEEERERAPSPVVIVPPAPAQPVQPEEERTMLERWGITLSAAGGVSEYTHDVADFTEFGAKWDVRLGIAPGWEALGAPLGLELAYVGVANSFANGRPEINDGADLYGNAFEGVVRLQAPRPLFGFVRPFIFGGAGVNQYNVVNDTFRVGIANDDVTAVVPAGGGLQLEPTENLVLDARFTWREMFRDDMFEGLGINPDIRNWNASARLGYRF